MKNNITLIVWSLLSFHYSFSQSYTHKITINNPLAFTLGNYQVLLKINTEQLISSGHMRSDCGDMRFLTDTASGGQNIHYWIERDWNTSHTHVWIKMPVLPSGDTDIYMTSGIPSLTSAANGDSVFIFFDDFQTGAIDPAKWNLRANATVNISESRFEAPAMQTNNSTANDNNLRTNINLPNGNYALHANFYDNGITSGVQNTWVGLRDVTLANSLYCGIRFGSDGTYYDYRQGAYHNAGIPRQTGTWHQTVIYQTSNQARITQDSIYDTGFFPNTSNLSYLSLYSHNSSTFFDNVFIRQLVDSNLVVEVNDTSLAMLLNEDWALFRAYQEDNKGHLYWNMHSPQQYHKLDIERSSNGYNFETIASNVLPNEKQYIDHSPIIGNNYYRIKCYGKKGFIDFSSIQQLHFKAANTTSIQLFPNPANSSIYIRSLLEEQKLKAIYIYNNLGQLVFQQQINPDMLAAIKLDQLQAGTYQVRIETQLNSFHRTLIKR